MSRFVLVHGSGQNARCWDRVGASLRERGHAVVAPDLPKRASSWSLGDYAAEIAGSISDPGTVVVAHSFSGVFLPHVARLRPCGLLVFLAAVIPEPGRSVREQFAADPGMFSREWIEAGPRWFDPSQQDPLSREFLFHDCDEATLPWALGTVEMYDTRTIVTEPAPFTRWPPVPVASIVAADDRTLTAEWGRRTARRVLRTDPLEIAGGHCPQASRPEETARLLEELATRCPA